MDEAARDGLACQQFARYSLTLAPCGLPWHRPPLLSPKRSGAGGQVSRTRAGEPLDIGHDLARIALDPKHPRRLASEAELLALRPELNHLE
jgi:hypothetical protein